MRLHRIDGEVQRVRDVRRPRQRLVRLALVHRDGDQPGARRDACDLLVHVARLAEHRPVHRVQARRRDRAGDDGRGRAGVVVDHVEVVRALEARERVADLGLRAADLLARRDCVDERQLGLRVRVAGREQRHVVPRVDETVGEQRDDPLDPAVAGRRNGEPHRREDRDLHSPFTLTRPSSSRTSQTRSNARTPASSNRARPRGDVLRRDRLDAALPPVRPQPEQRLEQEHRRARRPRLRPRGRRVRDGNGVRRAREAREDLRQLVVEAARRLDHRVTILCTSGERSSRARPAAESELSWGQTVPLW